MLASLLPPNFKLIVGAFSGQFIKTRRAPAEDRRQRTGRNWTVPWSLSQINLGTRQQFHNLWWGYTSDFVVVVLVIDLVRVEMSCLVSACPVYSLHERRLWEDLRSELDFAQFSFDLLRMTETYLMATGNGQLSSPAVRLLLALLWCDSAHIIHNESPHTLCLLYTRKHFLRYVHSTSTQFAFPHSFHSTNCTVVWDSWLWLLISNL